MAPAGQPHWKGKNWAILAVLFGGLQGNEAMWGVCGKASHVSCERNELSVSNQKNVYNRLSAPRLKGHRGLDDARTDGKQCSVCA